MEKNAEIFSQGISDLEKIDDKEGIYRWMAEYMPQYNLKFAAYHLLDSLDPAEQTIVHTYPSDWASYYIARRYVTVDPVVHHARRSIMPLDWSEIRVTDASKKLFLEAMDVGLGRNGITLPIRDHTGPVALFSITSDIEGEEWARFRRIYMRDMQMFAHYVHNIATREKRNRHFDAVSLTRREIEVLQWSARGKTADVTASILDISPRSVQTYYESARKIARCNQNARGL